MNQSVYLAHAHRVMANIMGTEEDKVTLESVQYFCTQDRFQGYMTRRNCTEASAKVQLIEAFMKLKGSQAHYYSSLVQMFMDDIKYLFRDWGGIPYACEGPSSTNDLFVPVDDDPIVGTYPK